jgi:hypothetical protein
VTIKLTVHRGELKRYEVDVECKTRDSRVQKAYNGMRTNVLVFATNRKDARAAAVEKMKATGRSTIPLTVHATALAAFYGYWSK